jgi:hypothetical protein
MVWFRPYLLTELPPPGWEWCLQLFSLTLQQQSLSVSRSKKPTSSYPKIALKLYKTPDVHLHLSFSSNHHPVCHLYQIFFWKYQILSSSLVIDPDLLKEDLPEEDIFELLLLKHSQQWFVVTYPFIDLGLMHFWTSISTSEWHNTPLTPQWTRSV